MSGGRLAVLNATQRHLVTLAWLTNAHLQGLEEPSQGEWTEASKGLRGIVYQALNEQSNNPVLRAIREHAHKDSRGVYDAFHDTKEIRDIKLWPNERVEALRDFYRAVGKAVFSERERLFEEKFYS